MNKHETLLKAIGRLNYNHCFVLRTNSATKVPVIKIANPCEQLARTAVEVTELRHGTLNKMHVARFCGCIVRWWSNECTQYVGNTVINSQENQFELQSFWRNLKELRSGTHGNAHA